MQNIAMMKTLREQQEQISKFVNLQTTTSGFLKDIEANVKNIQEKVCDDNDDSDN
jgi:hypothetical protein